MGRTVRAEHVDLHPGGIALVQSTSAVADLDGERGLLSGNTAFETGTVGPAHDRGRQTLLRDSERAAADGGTVQQHRDAPVAVEHRSVGRRVRPVTVVSDLARGRVAVRTGSHRELGATSPKLVPEVVDCLDGESRAVWVRISTQSRAEGIGPVAGCG